jgi:hypothetical protein
LCLTLLFAQEIDDEFLIVLDEVVVQALVGQVLPEMLAPQGIERIKQRKLGHGSPAVQARGGHGSRVRRWWRQVCSR